MDFQQQIGARTLAQEARGEILAGQQAVAWTLRNRISTGRWGANLASVCLWHGQFSGWWCPRGTPIYHDPNFAYACDLSDDDPILAQMAAVLDDVLSSPAENDPTRGATHYANLAVCNPAWVEGAVHCGKIGRHDFFRGVK